MKQLKKRVKFWERLLKLLKKDVKKDYLAEHFNQEDIDKQLFANYKKTNHKY